MAVNNPTKTDKHMVTLEDFMKGLKDKNLLPAGTGTQTVEGAHVSILLGAKDFIYVNIGYIDPKITTNSTLLLKYGHQSFQWMFELLKASAEDKQPVMLTVTPKGAPGNPDFATIDNVWVQWQ